jgi:hypothetical protein
VKRPLESDKGILLGIKVIAERGTQSQRYHVWKQYKSQGASRSHAAVVEGKEAEFSSTLLFSFLYYSCLTLSSPLGCTAAHFVIFLYMAHG